MVKYINNLKIVMQSLQDTINSYGIKRAVKNLRKTPSLLGIDINDQFIVLVELDADGQDLTVISYAIKKLPMNAIVNGAIKNPDIVCEQLLSLIEEANTRTKKVAIAVSGSSVITKTIYMPANLNDDYLEAKIFADADKYIPYPLDDVSIDFATINTGGNKDSEILLAACRKEMIDERVDILTKIGLDPVIVDIKIYNIERAFSLIKKNHAYKSNEIIALFERNSGLSLTVIKGETAVFHKEGSFVVNDNETDRAIDDKVKSAENELLQLVGEDNKNEDKEKIALHIQAALQFFMSSSQHEQIDRIILAGNFLSINELSIWLGDWLKIPTSVANPLAHMQVAESVDCHAINDNGSLSMVACGLAMRGLSCQ
tara:strand:- start:2537 stop:3649 length:1113 start_codon:yes stop_codon:yes gene_type:complete